VFGRAGPGVSSFAGPGAHPGLERGGEGFEFALGDLELLHTTGAERQVHPGGLEGVLAAAARTRLLEQAVERGYFGGAGNVRRDLCKPSLGVASGREVDEQEGLVVLVESGEDVALDVCEVELRFRHCSLQMEPRFGSSQRY